MRQHRAGATKLADFATERLSSLQLSTCYYTQFVCVCICMFLDVYV
ncbi:hypothetical protein [Bacillus cereus]|nr:hypothetical protein [Bacillus cereus]